MKKLITICAVTAVLALLCLGGSPAFAEWTVVNLSPAGASSYAWGVSGGKQVGEVFVSVREYSVAHAALWSGTAASWVDLNPAGAGAQGSIAWGVSGGQQVGCAVFGDIWTGSGNYTWHASLWSGTAASWVDLNPAGSGESCAYGVSGGQQVGYARIGSVEHAGLWSGTDASWVDLNPAEATDSIAYGVFGGQQVGCADFGDGWHAGLWSGTAESWVDLHDLLPAGVYSFSEARSIDVSAGEIWVAGYAGGANAMLWHYIPEPATMALLGLGGLGLLRRKRGKA